MCVDPVVEKAEDVTGSLLLDPSDQIGDLVVPRDARQRVDVPRVLCPDACDGRSAGVGVGLVPRIEVALDQLGCFHLALLSMSLTRRDCPSSGYPSMT